MAGSRQKNRDHLTSKSTQSLYCALHGAPAVCFARSQHHFIFANTDQIKAERSEKLMASYGAPKFELQRNLNIVHSLGETRKNMAKLKDKYRSKVNSTLVTQRYKLNLRNDTKCRLVLYNNYPFATLKLGLG